MSSSKQSPRSTRKRLRQGTLNSLAQIPEGSDLKRNRKSNIPTKPPGSWSDQVKGLMLFEPHLWKQQNTILGKQATTVKIAAFDLDSTIITTKTRAKFPKSPNDWRLLNARVLPMFLSLVEQDYVIVIFTNQAGVSNGRINETFVKTRLHSILLALKADIGVFVATAKDNFRKPATGMWDILVQMIGGIDRIQLDQSFYVGDAAGRPARQGHAADFSDSDLRFSINIGLQFRTPENYFLGKTTDVISNSISGFDPRQLVQSHPGSTFIDQHTDLDALLADLVSPNDIVEHLRLGSSATHQLPNVQTMVLMHGFPASGKTTFVKRHLLPRGYVWVNQDSVHTFSRCVRALREGLANGKSVVVDNTNGDRNARAKYIDIGKVHNADMKIVCLQMNTKREVAEHLNIVRERESIGACPHVPKVAYHAYQKRVQAPQLDERIDHIGQVRFVPCFSSEHEKYMFTRLS